mmetsp:Transcript_6003/g.13334  ORF Transcript_6003/g.13334 Transcript_6003/m.13334 type:complete len:341 (-) Transcript_6003:314-1336(-)
MQALCKTKIGRGLSLVDIDVPKIESDEVLIKVLMTGICGTDLHILNWTPWAQRNIKPGLILGHEFVGEIVDCGSAVEGIKIGDRVTAEGHIYCNSCVLCFNGKPHLCPNIKSIGISRNGAFSEYVAIPQRCVIKIPSYIPDKLASVLDPFGNSVHCAMLDNCKGKDVLIQGAGPTGLFLTAILNHLQARSIIVLEPNLYRQRLAANLGATVVSCNIKELRKDCSNKLENISLCYEMSGVKDGFSEIQSVTQPGGTLILLGLINSNKIFVDINSIVLKGITIRGIYGRIIPDTWNKMFEMLNEKIEISKVITHTFHFEDFEQAFQLAMTGKCGKVIINWRD